MSVFEDDRYDRQERLAEIGPSGQAKIESFTAEVHGKDGSVVEAQYLHRAGVRSLVLLPGQPPGPFVHAEWFRSDAARTVAAGAWRALVKLKRALAMEMTPP